MTVLVQTDIRSVQAGHLVEEPRMPDLQPRDKPRSSTQDAVGVSYFASQVVSLLADRSAKTVSELRETLVSELIAAATSGTKEAFSTLLAEMRRSRISLAALADIYIPEAARRLGQAWQDDQLSWMDVSIGAGRMQSLLREIGLAWSADQADDTGNGTVMLIVPDREQHTLGPMVAMGQMRRLAFPFACELRQTTMNCALLWQAESLMAFSSRFRPRTSLTMFERQYSF